MKSPNQHATHHRPIFIARQPIYNRQLEVLGYELLYRASDVAHAEINNGEEASSQVILNSFINIGIDTLVGSALAFINVPTELIINDTLIPMFHQQTVLEVLENVEPIPAVIAGLKRLKQRGFRMALDDHQFQPALRPLLELADFVKVDVLSLNHETLARQVGELRHFPVKLIAEKIESSAMLTQCQQLGFDGYQGYFFQVPQTLVQRSLPSNKAVVVAVIQQLANPELDINQLESVLANDVVLTYKLLRYVNSAAFGHRREITSLRDAIALVGSKIIRQWAMLLLLDSVNLGKPQELIRIAMIRAHMAENVAGYLYPDIKPMMFITGLLSVLDILMETPMEVLLDDLTLSSPIRFALLNREGPIGKVLNLIIDYELARWETLLSTGTDPELLTRCYYQSVQWADKNMSALFD